MLIEVMPRRDSFQLCANLVERDIIQTMSKNPRMCLEKTLPFFLGCVAGQPLLELGKSSTLGGDGIDIVMQFGSFGELANKLRPL